MKSKLINIRVSEEEKESLAMEAQECGMSLSDLIRERIFPLPEINLPSSITIDVTHQ